MGLLAFSAVKVDIIEWSAWVNDRLLRGGLDNNRDIYVLNFILHCVGSINNIK